ncbi:hypothetical protein D3C80_1841910 [compost metagenome]
MSKAPTLKFPKKDSQLWLTYSESIVNRLDSGKLEELGVEEQCKFVTHTLTECARVFPTCKARSEGVDNRRVRR